MTKRARSLSWTAAPITETLPEGALSRLGQAVAATSSFRFGTAAAVMARTGPRVAALLL
jgi:hypothetical protein